MIKKLSTTLILIAVLACIVRVAFVSFMPLEASDAGRYILLAENIIKYHSFTLDGITPTDIRPPLYSAFIAAHIYLFNAPLSTIVFTQILLDACTCILIFVSIYILLGNRLIALLGALIAVIHPALIASSTVLLSETLATFLLTTATTCLLLGFKKRRFRLFAASGLLLGLATLTKPITLPYPLLLLVLLLPALWKDTELRRLLAVYLSMFIISIAPWIVRNYIAFDRFMPVSSNVGGNLWIGSYEPWDGNYHPDIIAIRHKTAQRIGHQGGPHYPVDDALKDEAIARIKADPVTYARLCVKKCGRFWFSVPGEHAMLKDKTVLRLLLYGFYYTLFLLFVTGSALIIKTKKDRLPMLALASLIILFTGMYSLLVALPRYRIPVEPVIIIIASYALHALLRRSNFSIASSTSSDV